MPVSGVLPFFAPYYSIGALPLFAFNVIFGYTVFVIYFTVEAFYDSLIVSAPLSNMPERCIMLS